MFEYDSLPRSRSRADWMIAPWSNAVGGSASTPCQARVGGNRRVDAEGHEPEVGRRDLPLDRVAVGRAVGRDLLEVGDLGQIDLRREVAADRGFERLGGGEDSAGECPAARERLERALPEQDLQDSVPDLQHRGEGDLCRSGRLGPRFTTHSQKLAKGSDDDKTIARDASAAGALVAAVALLAAGCGGQ